MQYGIMTWGSTYKTRWTIKDNETVLPYYNLLELLTLDDIYKFRVAAFGHKTLIQQNDIPEIFSHHLESVSSA